MPRPRRCRRVCAEPSIAKFLPQPDAGSEPVVLHVDEYEVMRIVDLEKRSHEECAAQMEISRTTVTEIYEKARFKVADAIVNGRPLVIAGGHYRICLGENCTDCPGRGRRRHCSAQSTCRRDGDSIMKIAIPFKNDNIYQHFGMAEVFKVYTVEGDKIASTQLVESAGGHGHAGRLNVLVKNGVDCLICGGIGPGAIQAVADAGIKLYAGNSGSADEAAAQLLAGGLANDLQAAQAKSCGHHRHGHGHDEEQGCGCGHKHGEGCGCGRHQGEECGCGHEHHGENCGCGHEHHGEHCGCGHEHGEEGCGCRHGHGHVHGHGGCCGGHGGCER